MNLFSMSQSFRNNFNDIDLIVPIIQRTNTVKLGGVLLNVGYEEKLTVIFIFEMGN